MGETILKSKSHTYHRCARFIGGIVCAFVCIPTGVYADVVISEIMYDAPSDQGGDDTHEWIELMNTGSEPVDLTGWKVNDGSNHVLNAPPKNGGTGSLAIPAGGYVIVADDAAVFLGIYPVGVSVIDSSLGLNNAGDTVALVDRDGVQIAAVTYEKSAGAAGDGNSLQLVGTYVPAIPTPGRSNRSDAYVEETKNKKQHTESTQQHTTNNTGKTANDTGSGLAVEAGEDRTAIVGVPVAFSAVGVMSAGYEWNFGDGTTGTGAQVVHAYDHSGRYTAVVSMRVDGKTFTDDVVVSVSGADVSLRIVPGGVEIKNNGRTDIDISQWRLMSNGAAFSIHDHTYIAAGSSIVLNESAVGFSLQEDTILALSNGKEMAKVESSVVSAARAIIAGASKIASSKDTDATDGESLTADGVTERSPFEPSAKESVEETLSASSSQRAAAYESKEGFHFPLWGAGLAGLVALGVLSAVAIQTSHAPEASRENGVERSGDEDEDAEVGIHTDDGSVVTAEDFEIVEISGEHQLL